MGLAVDVFFCCSSKSSITWCNVLVDKFVGASFGIVSVRYDDLFAAPIEGTETDAEGEKTYLRINSNINFENKDRSNLLQWSLLQLTKNVGTTANLKFEL